MTAAARPKRSPAQWRHPLGASAGGVRCDLQARSWTRSFDTEQTFEQLQARIARTLALIDGIDPASFAGSETIQIVLRPGSPKERTLDGKTYLLAYGLPQFFFHVTTAYALLRHNGVEVGKKDYMGVY